VEPANADVVLLLGLYSSRIGHTADVSAPGLVHHVLVLKPCRVQANRTALYTLAPGARWAGGAAGLQGCHGRFCFDDWNTAKEVMPQGWPQSRSGIEMGPDACFGFAEILTRTPSPADRHSTSTGLNTSQPCASRGRRERRNTP
jgi:hypothetical protein